MTEPSRWLESGEVPETVTALLAAARPPRPLDALTRARSRRRLGAMTAIPAAAGVFFWLKSVALGAVLGSVVTASVVAIKWPARQSTAESAPAAAGKRTHRVPAKAVEVPAIAPLPDPSSEPNAEPSAAPSASLVPNGASASRASAPVPDVATENLEREIQLLERARQLMKGNPTLALSALDQHRREFGSGTLVLERQFLEVEALLRLGRRDQAVVRAADLRARAPGSLYERRLTQLLGNE